MFKKIKNKWLREGLSWASLLVVAFLINLLIREHVFAITKIEGQSMQPTLENHERVYLNRLAYDLEEPKRGDIVVFPAPNDTRDYIKRIIGLSGDEVKISQGVLYLNGEKQAEKYIDTITNDFPPTIVPDGHVFVMGDNRHPGASLDSRDPRVGFVPEEILKGRVDFVLYPSLHWVDTQQ
ncbi:signal peptidase I [Tumebacillus algifaecis]|uniref:Signal peptidase I n=1 Tax=Tumebacillus algifaecis TaxID=1214604 RepID=A0A223D0G7_9BACL|nr:signal peptidase I [Tumebacillus algifaecis]ASS75100.1 signal peptidase I [Tumebacillus algifaecis]